MRHPPLSNDEDAKQLLGMIQLSPKAEYGLMFFVLIGWHVSVSLLNARHFPPRNQHSVVDSWFSATNRYFSDIRHEFV